MTEGSDGTGVASVMELGPAMGSRPSPNTSNTSSVSGDASDIATSSPRDLDHFLLKESEDLALPNLPLSLDPRPRPRPQPLPLPLWKGWKSLGLKRLKFLGAGRGRTANWADCVPPCISSTMWIWASKNEVSASGGMEMLP